MVPTPLVAATLGIGGSEGGVDESERDVDESEGDVDEVAESTRG